VDPSAGPDAPFSSTRGRLLVATPDLREPNFARSVVLMLEHSDEGALGIVLNRPTDVRVADALPDWADVCAAPACLFIGGPVQPDAVIAVGRIAAPAATREPVPVPDGFTELYDGLGTVDLDATSAAFASVRVFVGYAGWAPGQLEGELAGGGWIVVDRTDGDVDGPSPSDLWRHVLRRQPGRTAIFALAPDDPSVN
jgi:putative transcriptional regulator